MLSFLKVEKELNEEGMGINGTEKELNEEVKGFSKAEKELN
jgi:hypothetical protein